MSFVLAQRREKVAADRRSSLVISFKALETGIRTLRGFFGDGHVFASAHVNKKSRGTRLGNSHTTSAVL